LSRGNNYSVIKTNKPLQEQGLISKKESTSGKTKAKKNHLSINIIHGNSVLCKKEPTRYYSNWLYRKRHQCTINTLVSLLFHKFHSRQFLPAFWSSLDPSF
jgi:hypothetical protein